MKVGIQKMKTIISKIDINNIDKNEVENTVYELMIGEAVIEDCIQETQFENLSILPSNVNLAGAEIELIGIEEKEYMLDPYINTDILFLDDLGSENKINNVTNEYLYLIINERMQNGKKTVITTNLDFAQIQESYGERIFSRLMHKQQSLKIYFDGRDLRIKNKV